MDPRDTVAQSDRRLRPSSRPWHLWLVTVLVSGHGIWSAAIAAASLAGSPDLPFWAFYLFSIPILLTLLAAYFLWACQAWAVYCLAAVPVARLGTRLPFMQSNEPLLSSSFALQVLERLPPGQVEQLLFFLVCFIYAGFMKKRGLLG